MNTGATVHRDAATVVSGSRGLSASADITPPTRTGTVRMLTYNILFGRNWPESLAVIRDADADVICLQEIVPEEFDREPHTCVDRIIDDIGLPHDFVYLWGRGTRRLGNITFARDAVTDRVVLRTRPTQPYGMAHRVEAAGTTLTVANIHLSPMLGPAPLMFLPSELLRWLEARHLSRWAQTVTGPIVAAGDFNTFAAAPAYRRMASAWSDARSRARGPVPATRPTYGIPFVIDHIFISGDAAACEYSVITGGGSDHQAVLATLKVPIESAFVTVQSPV